MREHVAQRLIASDESTVMCLPAKVDSAEADSIGRCHGSPIAVPCQCPIPDLVPLSDAAHLRCDEQHLIYMEIGAELRDISSSFERHRHDRHSNRSRVSRVCWDTVGFVKVLGSVARTVVIPYLHLLNGLYWIHS